MLVAACVVGVMLVEAAGLSHRTPASGQSGKAATAIPRTVVKHHSATPSLSIASIFSTRAPSIKGLDLHKLRTLIATGDVIPARSVNYMMVTRNDFLYPFRPTAAYTRTGDITLINLESPLISANCPVTVEGMQFCGDPRVVAGLQYAGVDVACTANNHIGNYGNAAILETWQHLTAGGIQHCGLSSVAYRTVRG